MSEYGLPHVSESPVQFPKEIFAHFTGAEILEGVTITLAAGEELESGTVLGRLTADGKYIAYDNTGTDGEETAVAVLRKHVYRPDGDAGDTLGEAVFGQAVLKLDQLVGLDAGAVADLGGTEDAVRNTFAF